MFQRLSRELFLPNRTRFANTVPHLDILPQVNEISPWIFPARTHPVLSHLESNTKLPALHNHQDDLSVPATVEMAVETAEQTHADMVMFSTQRLYEDGNRLPCDTVLQPGLLETAAIKTELLDQMLMNTGNTVVSCITHVWANLYRRERVVQWGIRFKRFVDYEDDYLFVFDYLRCAQKVAMIKPVGYYWRYNLKSETYRQKYIPGIVQRYENWYRYMLRCMDETG